MYRLDNYDLEEIKANIEDFDDLIFVVETFVQMAYDSGYEEGYNASKEDE